MRPLAFIFALPLLLLGCAHRLPALPWVELAGQRFLVTVADTPERQAQGLSGIPMLPDNHGMLFVMPSEAIQPVWMKDTLIPLDVLFFDGDKRLVSMLQGLPPCAADPCPIYYSGQPARFVLELNAGQAAALNLSPGATLATDSRLEF